jgi:hypothetical protein
MGAALSAALSQAPYRAPPGTAVTGRGCVKTSARFRTDLFRSLLRGLRAFRIEKSRNNFALLDPSQIFAEFSHGLGRVRPFAKHQAIDVSEGRITAVGPNGKNGRIVLKNP